MDRFWPEQVLCQCVDLSRFRYSVGKIAAGLFLLRQEPQKRQGLDVCLSGTLLNIVLKSAL